MGASKKKEIYYGIYKAYSTPPVLVVSRRTDSSVDQTGYPVGVS